LSFSIFSGAKKKQGAGGSRPAGSAPGGSANKAPIKVSDEITVIPKSAKVSQNRPGGRASLSGAPSFSGQPTSTSGISTAASISVIKRPAAKPTPAAAGNDVIELDESGDPPSKRPRPAATVDANGGGDDSGNEGVEEIVEDEDDE